MRLRRRREHELEEEIRFHLDTEAEQGIAGGLSATEAREAARRAFGSVALSKEITRQMWGWNLLARIGQDTRYAARTLARTPAFSVTAVLSLALGIGATVASFSIADALLLRPLPVSRPSEVLAINGQSPHNQFEGVSYPDLRDLRRDARSFTDVVGYRLNRFAFARSHESAPQMKFGIEVSQGFFDMLGVQAIAGRTFTADEVSTPGRDAVALLGHDFWRQELGADPGAVGRTIRLNGTVYTVVGVLPEEFTGMDPVIRPAVVVPATMRANLEDRAARILNLRARMKPGVTIDRAQSELTALSASLEREHPEADRDRILRAHTEFQLRVRQSPPTAITVTLLVVLSAIVLAIACANVAGLLLARSRARTREIAIRTAIGAGRGRLVQQFLTESAVVALCGGGVGVLLALGFIRWLESIRLPTDTPMVLATQVDGRVLAFALLASLASAILFGILPAWRSVAPPNAHSRGRSRGRNVLVCGQVALSLVLLVTSGALLDAFRRMLVLDPGIRTDHIMMFEFDPTLVGYTPTRATLFLERLVERARALPGVRSATLSRAVPFRPNFTDQRVVPEGYQFSANQTAVSVATNIVDESYFATMRTPILEGRAFARQDTASSRRVAIVNREFASRYWSGQPAVGKRLRIGVDGPYLDVVGVARTGKYLSLTETPQPYIYLPWSQNQSARMTLMVETEGAPSAQTAAVLREAHALDPNQPAYNVRDLDTYYEQGPLGMALIVMQMVGAAGVAGLMLALVGLYGLVAYSVARRTREFGVRMAIGAGRASVLALVLREGLTLALIGDAVGIALSIPAFLGMSAALAGVGPLSVWTLVLFPAALVAVTLCACYVPAYRASRIDPTLALRYE
jgi:putative ABC transport system permease protein